MELISEEWIYIKKIKSGDYHLYEIFIQKYEKQLFNYILNLLDNNYYLAQDLTQESFIKAYKGLINFEPRAKFSTWLYRIARNLCLDFHRKNKIKIITMEDDLISNDTPEAALLSKEFEQCFQRAILQLNEEYKTVFCLRTFQGFTYDEIAEIIEAPVGTVRSRLARAREILRKQLQTYMNLEVGEEKRYVL